MKAVGMILVLLALVVPFGYILISDLIEASKRFSELFRLKLKPALITMVSSIIN